MPIDGALMYSMRFSLGRLISKHDILSMHHLLKFYNFYRSYQTATQGIWWMELANDLGTPRDMICPAKVDDDKRIFAMRILTVEGITLHLAKVFGL